MHLLYLGLNIRILTHVSFVLKSIVGLILKSYRRSREISNIGEKYRDALRQKEGELSATKQKLRSTETELRSIRSR